MRLIRRARFVLLAAFVSLALPSTAAADFLLEPFFAWSRNPPQSTVDQAQWHPGGGVAAEWTFGALIAGADVGYASSFFDPPQTVVDLIQSSYLLTGTGQFGVTRPWAAERRLFPFATAGLGLMRQQARDRDGLIDVTRNDWAWNIGGGARVMLTDYLGLRGEARYFRDLQQPYDQPSDLVANLSPLSFWRISIGGVVRFGN
jgi:opacity protein-like surface antigen